MGSEEVEGPYLELTDNPVRFEAVNQVTNVFFDDSNKQVFAVRSGGVMGVVVKGPLESDEPKNFRMEDHGPVISIKFSLDQKILAVQRSTTSVEFMNFNGSAVEAVYSQSCKKNYNVIGFVWSHHNEVALITDHGIELYLVIPEKKATKHLKSVSTAVQWFLWCAVNNMALLASQHGSHLLPVVIKSSTITKLPKLEKPGIMALERDVTLSTLYGVPSILILRHQSGPQMAEVHIHTLNGPGQAPIKSHVLRLEQFGRFAINVVDNLILVHHQTSRCSQVFDVALSGEGDGTVVFHKTVAPAKSIKPTTLSLPGIVESQTKICELYSPNWVVFQPNIVIDAKLGCLWHIKLRLKELCSQISSLSMCAQVALKRTGAKTVLLDLLLKHIKEPKPNLNDIQEAFSHINNVYRNWVEAEIQTQSAFPVNSPSSSGSTKTQSALPVLIDQNDIYTTVFQKLDADNELDKLEWILIAYLRSLFEYGIPAMHNVNELLVTTLVRKNKFAALQQLLQYGVISDSKPLGCLLLSLGNMHEAASQMALDMLSRLGAKEEIQEVLLSQGQVLSAIKLNPGNVNPRKFLQTAQSTDNPFLYHSTFQYFRNNPQYSGNFDKDDRLDNFVRHYKSVFES